MEIGQTYFMVKAGGSARNGTNISFQEAVKDRERF